MRLLRLMEVQNYLRSSVFILFHLRLILSSLTYRKIIIPNLEEYYRENYQQLYHQINRGNFQGKFLMVN